MWAAGLAPWWAYPTIGGTASEPERTALSTPFEPGYNKLGTRDRIQLSGLTSARIYRATDITNSRALTRTDGYADMTIEALVDGVVGTAGIRVDWKDDRINEAWELWPWNIRRPDQPFAALQRRMTRGIVRDGESLERLTTADGDLRVVELDPLDLPLYNAVWPDVRYGHARRVLGIDFDANTRPVSYNFIPYFGSSTAGGYSLPAREVVHVFREQFPGQARGFPWLASALEPLRDLASYEGGTIDLVALLNKVPGWFEVDRDAGMVDPIKEGDGENPGGATIEKMLEYAMNLDAGERGILPTGTKWTPATVPSQVGGGAYLQVRRGILTRIARSCGISYHAVTGDVSGANFSSLRHARLQDQATFAKTQSILLEGIKRIAMAWAEVQDIRGLPGARLAMPTFTTPTWPFIEPGREVMAQTAAVDGALRSRREIIEESGRDADKVFAELLAERELLAGQQFDEADDDDDDDDDE